MRALICDRIDIGDEDRETYFNPKELTFKESIDVGIRTAIRNRPSVKRKRENAIAKRNQEATERMENLKTVILGQIHMSMSPDENKALAKRKKKAKACTIFIDRQFADIVPEILKHQEFSGYITYVYRANPDILKAFPNFPILVKFEKTFV